MASKPWKGAGRAASKTAEGGGAAPLQKAATAAPATHERQHTLGAGGEGGAGAGMRARRGESRKQ